MTEEEKFNQYFIPGTEVLKNKLGIQDQETLRKREREITIEKLTSLYLNPIPGNFNKDHLKLLHKYIFGEIYDFAGCTRDVDIRKMGDPFLHYPLIDMTLTELLQEMNQGLSQVQSRGEYAFYLAGFYNSLIAIHPFREGNGRTIREFMREFIEAKNPEITFGNFELDFTKMDPDNLLLGCEKRTFYPSLLETEFLKALTPKEEPFDHKKPSNR